MIVAFSVAPSGGPTSSDSVHDAVAAAVRVVRESGLPNRTSSMFTEIEGEWDEVMAVVKADGYGHGVATAARAALDGGADQLGVVTPGEALALGGADLVVDLNARFSWDGLFAARAALVQAAAKAGLVALDVPYLELGDETGLRAECARLRDIGLAGKLAIHPAQVVPIRDSFVPDEKERAWASRILAALSEAGGSAVRVDGKLVDLPIRRMAERILARAG